MGNILYKLAPRSDASTSIYPPTSKFDPARDIPELSGKIVVVTGGNTGLGYDTAKQLLLKGAKVYIAARSPEKAAQAIERLKGETHVPADRVQYVKLDLADLNSVRAAAEDFLAREERCDVLYNNGGVMATPPDMLTTQNYDLQFGTNVLGHFFFTELLIPALRASHAASGIPARIVNISSWGHNFAPGPTGFSFDTLRKSEARDKQIKSWGGIMAPWRLYGQSKLGNLIISNHFAREYSDVLVSCAVHPGVIATDLGRHLDFFSSVMGNWLFHPPHGLGAYTQLWAGTTAEAKDINGQYLIPWARFAPAGTVNKMGESLETQRLLVEYLRTELKGY